MNQHRNTWLVAKPRKKGPPGFTCLLIQLGHRCVPTRIPVTHHSPDCHQLFHPVSSPGHPPGPKEGLCGVGDACPWSWERRVFTLPRLKTSSTCGGPGSSELLGHSVHALCWLDHLLHRMGQHPSLHRLWCRLWGGTSNRPCMSLGRPWQADLPELSRHRWGLRVPPPTQAENAVKTDHS
jgi:hypothetical protein